MARNAQPTLEPKLTMNRCVSGQKMEDLRGSDTAAYVGLMCDDWAQVMARDWDQLPTYVATGVSRAIMANRLSYFFDWRGPSMTIDTACSSSLVAVHQGVTALRNGECRVAVAAGVKLILAPGAFFLALFQDNGVSC
jgi:hybrid polyketide synthase/nonribosomal peptide synthetase ACE1